MHSQTARMLLYLVVFLAGVGTLGIEMLMPRLLAPFFGTSQPIWAVVIGTTLVYLAVGYWLGGVLADRWPSTRVLYWLIAWAGCLCSLVPLLARPVLRASQQAFINLEAGIFLAALVAVILLFAAPVILLATVSPFAIRLCLSAPAHPDAPHHALAEAGRTAGSISALSTLGSLVGTFLPVFLLIPWIGTEYTLYLFALFLVGLGLVGLRDWRQLWMLAVVALLAAQAFFTPSGVRAAGCYRCTVIEETESMYNYIQVVRQEHMDSSTMQPDTRLHLFLNEGHALHSTYRLRYRETGDPLDLLTGGGPWDYFAVAPYVYPERDPQSVTSLAMLGAGAGTVPQQFLAIYGPQTRIDAVEIDPRILEMGRAYFDMQPETPRFPNYHVYAQDARAWLASLPPDRSYDVIGVDAYHQPYIPFHLTTAEFFRETQAHLAPDGVVVLNAARPPGGDDRLVNALASTMRSVFPQVFIIDTRHTHSASNALLVGVARPVGDGTAHFATNAERITVPALRRVMHWARAESATPPREFLPEHARFAPFTDDHAPVEQLIDRIIFGEAQRLTQ